MVRAQVATETLVDKYDLGEFIQPLKVKPAFGLEQALEEMVGCERVNIAETFFPTIDPRFLRLTIKEPFFTDSGESYLEYKLFLPRFAIFQVEGDGTFEIQAEIDLDCHGRDEKGKDDGHPYRYILSTLNFKPDLLNEIIRRNLADAVNVKSLRSSSCYNLYTMGWANSVTAYINGAIPRVIKQKVPYFKKIFGEELYLVSEAQWVDQDTRPSQTRDPLLVGTLGNRAYLLDQFNCTPLEYQIAKQMTTNPKGRRAEPCGLN